MFKFSKTSPSTDAETFDWVVINQSQTPAHQQMFERLAEDFGRCLVLTGTPHPLDDPDESRLTLRQGPSYDRRSAFHRATSWLKFTLWAARACADLRGQPFVFVFTNPPFLPHLAWLLHKVRGFPYGLLVWDIYPEHAVKMGIFSEGSIPERIWSTLNRLAFAEAGCLVTISRNMAETLEAMTGRSDRSFEIIPNWADVDFLKPLPKDENDFAHEHGQTDKITVMYSGNMGATHDLGIIAEAAHRLRDDDRIEFLLIGGGLGKAAIEERVDHYDLDNVTFLPRQPWEVLPQSLATADIALVTQAEGTEHLSIPSKTYSSLAVGAPIVAISGPSADLHRFVSDHDLGAAVTPGDADGLAEAIANLADDAERRAEIRRRARALAVDRFSEDAVFAQFDRVLGPLVRRDT